MKHPAIQPSSHRTTPFRKWFVLLFLAPMLFVTSCQKEEELIATSPEPLPQQKYNETNLFPQGV